MVLLDCLLEDAKKEGLYGKRSDCLANLLRMIGMVLEGVKRKGRVEGYYPKCFSVVAGLMREGGRLGVENWGLVLDVLAGLVEGN